MRNLNQYIYLRRLHRNLLSRCSAFFLCFWLLVSMVCQAQADVTQKDTTQLLPLLYRTFLTLNVQKGSLDKLSSVIQKNEEHPKNIGDLSQIAMKCGVPLVVKRTSIQELSKRSCISVVLLRHRDEDFRLITSIGPKYVLSRDNEGVDYYEPTVNFARDYEGVALVLLPQSSARPVIQVINPIAEKAILSITSGVSARILVRNVSNRTIHLKALGCGCSGQPRGTVTHDKLLPGEVAYIETDFIPHFWAPEVLLVPMTTDAPECPTFFVALMATTPSQVHIAPSTLNIDTLLGIASEQSFILSIPNGWHLKGISLEQPIVGLSIDKPGKTLEDIVFNQNISDNSQVALVQCVLRITDKAHLGVIHNAVVVGVTKGKNGVVENIRVPVVAKVGADVHTYPSQLFLGFIDRSDQPGLSFDVSTYSGNSFSIASATSSLSSVQVSVPLNQRTKRTTVSVALKVKELPLGNIDGSVKLTLTDGETLEVPISAYIQ